MEAKARERGKRSLAAEDAFRGQWFLTAPSHWLEGACIVHNMRGRAGVTASFAL
jgi:hypothetical protein